MTTIDGKPDSVGQVERVVLCDERGRAVGTALKSVVHTAQTPLHLAFSCYLFDRDGRILVTRRAFDKRTWPGVRTNSCCGHPLPGESMVAAIRRRLLDELGVVPDSVDLLLPAFQYQATMTNEMKENELCPVYRAVVGASYVTPNPAEVSEAWWQAWPAFAHGPVAVADPLSPWSQIQLGALNGLGLDPLQWPVADVRLLPDAARP